MEGLVIAGGTPAAPVETAPVGTEGETKGKTTFATATTPEVAVVEKAEERPEWLPEKFKTVAAFVESHKALEAKLGSPKTEEKNVEATPAVTAAAKVVADAGIDMAALSKEFAENNGVLKAETMESLKAKGLSTETVNTYIEGQKAVAKAYTTEVAETVGGVEKMNQMFEWAGKNMSAEDIAAFNQATSGFNKPLATLALKGLEASYTAAMGTEPTLINGEAAPVVAGAQPYASMQEVMLAMRDPRYKNNDPAYHRVVRDRLSISNV